MKDVGTSRVVQWFSSVRFSCSVVSDPLQHYGLQPTSPLSVGFSRQEYWSVLPCPSPGDLPNPGMEPRCPAWEADSLPAEPQGKPSGASASVFSAVSQLEDSGFRLETRKLRRATWTLRKGGGMGRPTIKWASRCFQTTLKEESGMILISIDTLIQPNYHEGIVGKILKTS